MKNKNHYNKKTTPKIEVKSNPFLESVKKSCLAIGKKIYEKVLRLPWSLLGNSFAILFFIVLWALLAFYEDALLFRVNELSVFLYDDLYYEEMMSVPAGLLSYIACYLVQFFYNPVVGATIYVSLLVLVYWLTYKVFDISYRYRSLAMVPVVALLASNTQLGYWIFYLKLPGYYYVALLGVILSLLATWIVKKSHVYLKPLLVAAWMFFAYPYLGIYAIVSGVIMGIHTLCLAIGRRYKVLKIAISSVSIVVSVIMYNVVPDVYYTEYTTVPSEEMLTAGIPASQWKNEHVPDIAEKEAVVSFVSGINGCVGYPVEKELSKFKMSVDASFSEKAIKTAKDDLFASSDINKPVDGKVYTFTFVGKNGLQYYLDNADGNVSLKQRNGDIPQTGYFVCDVDEEIKDIVMFRTLDGEYLSWEMVQTQDSTLYKVDLVASEYGGNTRCVVMKMKKGSGVLVDDNNELFGLVNLWVFDKDTKFRGDVHTLFVAGVDNGILKGNNEVQFNDSLSTALRIEEVGFIPAPISLTMTDRSMWYNMNTYWVPFWLLLIVYVIFAVVPSFSLWVPRFLPGPKWVTYLVFASVYTFVALCLIVFSYCYWYDNENFRIENEQNVAMWNEEWEDVAQLAKDASDPTRQVVINKNIALLKLGKLGDEMFHYPDGGADIEAPMPVRLAQTGGKMAYYQYGKFNFCYRWCVEDAVEYGWRIEYLKHAVRSMILAGEHRLAERYIRILKRTKFYADWANEMEKYIYDPKLIDKQPEFKMPFAMACYDDALDVDNSYVEAYLINDFKKENLSSMMSREYVDAALASALIRKDSQMFCVFLRYYIETFKVRKLPKHYQEAALLFFELERKNNRKLSFEDLQYLNEIVGSNLVQMNVRARLNTFQQSVSMYQGMSEVEMAPFFKDDFGDTYYYYYFFVRNIKTN